MIVHGRCAGARQRHANGVPSYLRCPPPVGHQARPAVDDGHQTRTVPEPLWQLLVTRDRGCRFDECEIPADMCDAHHATHWSDNGDTAPDNMTLLCWFHHHFLHEQHWKLEPLGGGHFELRKPDGDYMRFRPPTLDIITRPDQLTLAP